MLAQIFLGFFIFSCLALFKDRDGGFAKTYRLLKVSWVVSLLVLRQAPFFDVDKPDVAMELRKGESFRGANTSHVRATSNAVFPIVPTVSKAVVRWKIFFMETTPGVSFRA